MTKPSQTETLRSHHEDCLSQGCDWPQVNLTPKAMLCPGAQEVAPEPRLGGESIVDGGVWGGARAVGSMGEEGSREAGGREGDGAHWGGLLDMNT